MPSLTKSTAIDKRVTTDTRSPRLRRFGDVIRHVARTFAIDPRHITRAGRQSAPISRARHIVMYLGHRSLGLSHQEIGVLLKRSRTTVLHGCATIEAARNDPAMAATLRALEHVLRGAPEAAR
jgi:chromosomal replication initiation ATPase DnaA